MAVSKNTYFAADKAEETINYLEDKANGWYNHIQRNGLLMKMVTSWSYYYGQFYDSSHEITYAGESGELLNMPIAHYRNIAQHILVNITGSRPAFTCTAVNGDRKSLIQAQLGNGILSYYMKTARFERKFKKATEYSIVMGTGYLLTEWNATKGRLIGRNDINEDLIESYDEETMEPLDEDGNVVQGSPIFGGDITCRVLSPLDVLFDFTKDDPELNDWYLARVFINKFDLIAKYPELKQQLLEIETKSSMTKRISLTPYNETTDIPVYLFFHRATEALPEGRMIMYADKDTVMEDTILPYPDLPIQRISPSDVLGSAFGYTPMFDLLPIQDAINSVYSTVLTNHNAFGVQNILNPIGNNVKFTQISDGMNWIEYDAQEGKPEALQLTKSSPESYNLIGILEKVMETISGVNSVSRGNPEASLKSGTALALVQAQSLQYMTGLQQSYIQLLEDSGTFMINLLKEFADEPRIVSISGINNSQRIKQFNNDDIVAIDRVTVDVGNALMQTSAGRWQVAENLLQMGLIKTPEKLLQLLNTGNLESLIDGTTNELDVINTENESLLMDEPVIAIALDAHAMHIREHKSVLSDPILRFDKELVERTLAHINEHIVMLRETDPSLLAITGEQPVGPQGGTPNAPTQPNTKSTDIAPQMAMQDQGQGVPNMPSPAKPPGEFEGLPQTSAELMATQG